MVSYTHLSRQIKRLEKAKTMAIGHIGKYERLDVLGSGASGVVYLAYDTLLRRQVALKEVRASGPELDRVLAEARLLDRLRHPALIAVHAVDEIDGVVIIDMELIRGANLSEIMRMRTRQPLPLPEVLTISKHVLDGLAHAHTNRVLHRDIKPANILIGTDGKTVKLTDFGLAELLSSSSLAGGGGTYPYMAPEDFDENASSDRRSDLWAVGIVVYEMLTGHRPFTVEKTRDPFAWKRAIDSVEPDILSTLGLDLPLALDAVMVKALAKDKEQRFQTAAEFSDALMDAAGVAPAEELNSARPNSSSRMRAPLPNTHFQTDVTPIFVFPDGNATMHVEGFLAGAARNWDFSCLALADGRFETFLFTLEAIELASLARSLASNNTLSANRRLRTFLEYAQPDPEGQGSDPSDDCATFAGVGPMPFDKHADHPVEMDDLNSEGGEVTSIQPPKPAANHNSMDASDEDIYVSIGAGEADSGQDSGGEGPFYSREDDRYLLYQPAGTEPLASSRAQQATATLDAPRVTTDVLPDRPNQVIRATAPNLASAAAEEHVAASASTFSPKYRTYDAPIALRFWYWWLTGFSCLPAGLGILASAVGTPVALNVPLTLYAITGLLFALQMIIVSAVRMPAWAVMILTLPLGIGLMAGGMLGAILSPPGAGIAHLVTALSPLVFPFCILAAAAVSARRTWKVWVVVHVMTTLLVVGDITLGLFIP